MGVTVTGVCVPALRTVSGGGMTQSGSVGWTAWLGAPVAVCVVGWPVAPPGALAGACAGQMWAHAEHVYALHAAHLCVSALSRGMSPQHAPHEGITSALTVATEPAQQNLPLSRHPVGIPKTPVGMRPTGPLKRHALGMANRCRMVGCILKPTNFPGGK